MDCFEFSILGVVEVRRGGKTIAIKTARQRALLVALLLGANRVVSVDRLIEQLWGQWPPASARNTIQSLVCRIRPLLNSSVSAGEDVLVTRQPGYLLRVEPGCLDLEQFEKLATTGRAALLAAESQTASHRLRKALALWRGEPLADAGGVGLQQVEVPRLQERRLQVVEDRVEADLMLGRHGDLIAELAALITQHPLRERLYGQYMRALYGAGRQAEALQTYDTLRHQLTEDLGIEPGAELQELHQAVLRGGLYCARQPQTASPAPAPQTAVPAQLPRAVRGFTGRSVELTELNNLLTTVNQDPTTVVISALSGTAGVGKTALAVHWAHQVRDRFPDGQLYVNLRGFDPSGSAMDPAEAVRDFLGALQVPPQHVPVGLNAQAALYRSLLSDRRVLIVLDNARDSAQVRPLLPGTPGCLALITSRTQLSSLIATDAAHPITVDLLPVHEARQLLSNRLGTTRTAAEPHAIDQLINRCARLPLALAIMAARAATHAHFTLATLAAELADSRERLHRLASEDPHTDVTAVFSWSYHTLSPEAARVFRLLGLHPGPDISAPAAASLTALPLGQVHAVLGELVHANMLTEHLSGRYTVHDLLRDYAADLIDSSEFDDERRAAERRMLQHYLHTAHTADRLLYPVRDQIQLDQLQPGVIPETPTDYDQAMAWFTTEHAVLLAAVNYAANTGTHTYTWQLAWALMTFLDRRGHWHDWATTAKAAMTAAGQSCDPAAQDLAHRSLATACMRLGRFDDAHIHLRHALDLSTQTGDQAAQAHSHLNTAEVYAQQGHHAEASAQAQQALCLYRTIGHQRGQAQALNALGWYHCQLGDYQQALTYCQQALSIHQDLHNRHGQAGTWDSLGYTHHYLGHHTQAITCYQHALQLFQDLGNQYLQAQTLTHLGDAHQTAGIPEAARNAWQQALAILDELHHPDVKHLLIKLAV